MSAVGGSIESISINGRIFAVAADADATIFIGGRQNEVQVNGNGSVRVVKTQTPWSISGLTVSIDTVMGDLEFLQGIANAPGLVPVVVTMANGTSYAGNGTITDALELSTQNATASVSLSGEQALDLL